MTSTSTIATVGSILMKRFSMRWTRLGKSARSNRSPRSWCAHATEPSQFRGRLGVSTNSNTNAFEAGAAARKGPDPSRYVQGGWNMEVSRWS